jgi:N-acetylneuraminic acid mutarotase
MKKKPIIISILLLFMLQKAYTQSDANQWTWLKGANTNGQTGYYGTPGNVANTPGARFGAVTWTLNNKMYLFGGTGIDGTGSWGELNDLWEYNVASNIWIWLKGSAIRDQSGIYGNQGQALPANIPGGREKAVSWTYNGKLYLFGGMGYDTFHNIGHLNDLWVYDPATNNWAWLKGTNTLNSSANYGIKGASNISNIPGSRQNAGACEYNGNLYLFGGQGYIEGNITGYLNDLWVYNIATNNWTWISGDKITNQFGIYGAINIGSTANKPGSRSSMCLWQITNKLYLFGGYGYYGGDQNHNDLWEFNLTNNEWKWIKGDNHSNHTGVYGFQGTPHANNKPGSRYGASSILYNSKLYVLGGNGYDIAGPGKLLNDLWVFDLNTKNWTWLKGQYDGNIPGTYGVQLIPAISNKPGSRQGAVAWLYNRRFYYFGGLGRDANNNTGILNDLWSYTPACKNEDFFSLKNGNWSDTSVWSCGRIPQTTDQINIVNGHIITLNGNYGVKEVKFQAGNLVIPANLQLMLYPDPD